MESESVLLASTRVRVALSRVFSMPKGGGNYSLHYRLQYSALKTPATISRVVRAGA